MSIAYKEANESVYYLNLSQDDVINKRKYSGLKVVVSYYFAIFAAKSVN
jgi:hypothetical protein